MASKDKTGIFSIGGTYLSLFFATIWLLDFFDLCGRNYNPIGLSHFACATLPTVKIASPFVAESLINFSKEQCLNPPIHEPAISIIFFMGKISLTYFAAGYYILCQMLTEFPEFQQRLSSYKEKGGGIADVIKYKIKDAILKFSRWQNCKPRACGQALR